MDLIRIAYIAIAQRANRFLKPVSSRLCRLIGRISASVKPMSYEVAKYGVNENKKEPLTFPNNSFPGFYFFAANWLFTKPP